MMTDPFDHTPWMLQTLHETERAQRLESILVVGQAIAREMNLDRLLSDILPLISRAMGCDRTTIFLIDYDRREMWSRIAEGVERIRCPLTGSLAGFVATTGETVNIADAYADPRFDREIDRQTGYRTRSLLAMPMRNHQSRVIGVVEVLNKKDGSFNREDQEVLEVLAAMVAQQIENASLYEQSQRSFTSFIEALSAAVDAKDYATSGHSIRVGRYAKMIGRELRVTEHDIQRLHIAALLHDIGKIGVPDDILCKPSGLTPEEMKIIRGHVGTTWRILTRMTFPDGFGDIPRIASQHHERVDGTGYPEGLPSERIHPLGKILAVADFYDALISERHYRKPVPQQEVRDMLRQRAGTWFDPDVVAAFERAIDKEEE